MQRHLQSPVDKLEKLLAFGLPDGEFHRQPISSWYFGSEPPPATGGPHIYLCMCACVCVYQIGFTGVKGRPPDTSLPHCNQPRCNPSDGLSSLECREGWAVKLGLREEPGEAIRLRREAGEKAGRLVRTQAGWQTLSDPCAKLQ